ncbi:MAG: cobalamin-dependent protein, partial [Methanophagales archaeon]|nr:cobalamin-dependent protein [Methanophagales archaeon]
MEIILISPRLRAWSPNIWVPLGLTYIAAILENDGHSIEIIDLNEKKMTEDDLRNHLKKDVDVVGVTGMITEYQKILKIVDIAKEKIPDRKVILGGPLATTLPQQLLKQSKADFVVIGEGENVTLELVQAIEHGSDIAGIRGIAYKKREEVIINEPVIPISNLDAIPFPARHLLDMSKYIKNHFEIYGFDIKGYGKIRSTNLISSRGCPYDCTFCFKDMWGYKWRGRSAENIIAEMKLLNEKYSVNGFFFNDDTFVLNKKRVFEFTSLLKKSGLDGVWSCNGRVNLMQKDMLKAMHDAGCVSIAYGIESGNQSILDSMKKNITLNQTKNVVKW